MRELKSGQVVAAVVAVLEKQEENQSRSPFRSFHSGRHFLNYKEDFVPRQFSGRSDSSGMSKNSVCLVEHAASADENFQSAVKDFDCVAEDVQNIVLASNSLKRAVSNKRQRANLFKTSLMSKQETKIDSHGDDLSSSSDYSDTSSSDSDVEREHVICDGLDTITEEERHTNSSASYRGLEENESSLEDDSTVKDHNPWSQHSSNNGGSTSDLSSTSSERPVSLRDSSTRCNRDFQWIRKDSPMKMDDCDSLPLTIKLEERDAAPLSKPPISSRSMRDRTPKREKIVKTAPGSLDRRRSHQQSRVERDQKSRSTHMMKSPPRFDDYNGCPSFSPVCQNYCCSPPEGHCFENFHRRHERLDPQRYGSSPMLMDQPQRSFSDRGSHPDLYGDCNRFRHESMGCCNFHMAPPCCFYGDRGYHWMQPPYPKPGEQDEKFRKMQYERDNLQLQVQVLTEQIEAQSDKIADLEKMLQEKKYHLTEAEENLQREILSRSSLETQKLELMSIMSELKLQKAALERENMELRNSHYNGQEMKKPPVMPRMSPQPQMTSTPVQSSNQNMRMSPSPSPVSTSGASPRHDGTPKTPNSNYKRQIDIQYGSLPRQQFLSNGSTQSVNIDTNANLAANGGMNGSAGNRGKGVAFAESDKIMMDDGNNEAPGSPNIFNQKKGIKKIFGKMKRSGSGNLEDLPGINEFQRGGVRATAAARLGWSEPQIMPKPDKPFSEWDTENICDWLQDLGLDQYIQEAKRWVKSGNQLQEASMNDIEKELGIKNTLHRKKLQLALIDTEVNGSSDPFLTLAGKLDTAWVLRWLDDTGLPQHKENFLINRVDGRVLHRLTIDDLALLHVTSMLHVASIKRGIQVLRENNYEAGCLQRRSLPDDPVSPTPKDISLWTTHRVMEWLRAVDLAEYAPNLRGAGVHGGLMVFETKFTAELLAALLSIPPGKTLLRRHLNTHFKELLGKDIIQEKREAEATLGYIPLTPSSKLKVAKKSQFSLKRKKSKGEADYGDLVCPLNPDKSGELNGSAVNNSIGMMKITSLEEEDVCLRVDKKGVRSLPASIGNSPVPQRHV